MGRKQKKVQCFHRKMEVHEHAMRFKIRVQDLQDPNRTKILLIWLPWKARYLCRGKIYQHNDKIQAKDLYLVGNRSGVVKHGKIFPDHTLWTLEKALLLNWMAI